MPYREPVAPPSIPRLPADHRPSAELRCVPSVGAATVTELLVAAEVATEALADLLLEVPGHRFVVGGVCGCELSRSVRRFADPGVALGTCEVCALAVTEQPGWAFDGPVPADLFAYDLDVPLRDLGAHADAASVRSSTRWVVVVSAACLPQTPPACNEQAVGGDSDYCSN